MSRQANLAVVEEVLRSEGGPLRISQIIKRAGHRLSTTSRQPHNVLSRDLALDIRDNPKTKFCRVDKGLFDLKGGQ